MYGVNNHSMGSILAPPISYDYNLTDSFAAVSHGRTEDICDILEQIVSISSQSLDEAQMRSVAVSIIHLMLLRRLDDIEFCFSRFDFDNSGSFYLLFQARVVTIGS